MSQDKSTGEKIGKIFLMAVGAIVVMVVVSVILAIPTMLLWNWLMPDIFGLPKVGLLQALGLNILSSILLKSGSSSFNKKNWLPRFNSDPAITTSVGRRAFCLQFYFRMGKMY